MRINFRYTPDRKLVGLRLRRAEEGQALVIIAVFMLVVIWLLGLVADVEVANMESDRVRDTAEDAARSGAPYVLHDLAQADRVAALLAESRGFRVVCFYDGGKDSAANERCRRADLPSVTRAEPEQLYYFDSQAVIENNLIRYTVTLGKLQSRLLLSAVGFPNYTILKTATVSYRPTAVLPPPVRPTPTAQPPAKTTTTNGQSSLDAEIARLKNSGYGGVPGNGYAGATGTSSGSLAQQVCASLKNAGATAQNIPANCK